VEIEPRRSPTGAGDAGSFIIWRSMKYWEIIADNLSKAGWSWGCVSGVDSNGQTMFTVDAHRDEKRFVVRATKSWLRLSNLNRRFEPSLHKSKNESSRLAEEEYCGHRNHHVTAGICL
jgi:hypothetical protein